MNQYKRVFSSVLCLLLTVIAFDDSYAGKPPPPPTKTVTSVSLTSLNPSSALELDTPVLLKVVASWSDATTTDVTDDSTVSWSISPTGNATVKTGALLEGLRTGPVTVRAVYKNVTSNALSFTFSITGDPKRVTKLEMSPSSKILLKGAAADFTVTATYADKTTAVVTSQATISMSPTGLGTLSGGHFVSTAAGPLRLKATLNGVTSNSPQLLIYNSGDPNIVLGTISWKNGGTLSLGALRVVFPAKAFGSNTTVALARYAADTSALSDPLSTIGESYLIDNQNTLLAFPAQLSLTYPAGSFGVDQAPAIAVDHSRGWELYTGTNDSAGNRYTIALDRFSVVVMTRFNGPNYAPALISGVPYYSQSHAPIGTRSGWCYVATVAESLGFYGVADPNGGDMKRWSVGGMIGANTGSGHYTSEMVPVFARFGIDLEGPTENTTYLSNLVKYLGTALVFGNANWFLHQYIKASVARLAPVMVASSALAHAFTIVGFDNTYVYYHDTSGVLAFGHNGVGSVYGRITWTDLDKALRRWGITVVEFVAPVTTPSTAPRSASADVYGFTTLYQDPDNGANVLTTTLNTDGLGHSRGYYYSNANASREYSADLGSMNFPGEFTFEFIGWPVDVAMSTGSPTGIAMVTQTARMHLAIHDPQGNTLYSDSKDFSSITDTRNLSWTKRIDLQGAEFAFAQSFNKTGLYDFTLTTSSSTSGARSDVTKMVFPFMALSSVQGTVMTNDSACGLLPAASATVTLPGLFDKNGSPAQATTDATGRFIVNHVDVGGVSGGVVQATLQGYSATGSLPQPEIGQVTEVGTLTITKPCASCGAQPLTEWRDGIEQPFAWQVPGAYSCLHVIWGSGAGGLTPGTLSAWIDANPGQYRCNIQSWPSGPNMPNPAPARCAVDMNWNNGRTVGLVWGATQSRGQWPVLLPVSNPDLCVIDTGYYQYICQ